jgi:hypothetical protein
MEIKYSVYGIDTIFIIHIYTGTGAYPASYNGDIPPAPYLIKL